MYLFIDIFSCIDLIIVVNTDIYDVKYTQYNKHKIYDWYDSINK